MRVLGLKENGMEMEELDGTLKSMQAFVEGYIEPISLTVDLDLVCNEEGKLQGLKPNVAWIEENMIIEIICGNCFVCRHTVDGDFCSVREEDVETVRKKLRKVILLCGETIVLEEL